jgi:hypothetical protein
MYSSRKCGIHILLTPYLNPLCRRIYPTISHGRLPFFFDLAPFESTVELVYNNPLPCSLNRVVCVKTFMLIVFYSAYAKRLGGNVYGVFFIFSIGLNDT